jgi:diguanylate cyclase (GGDEF)-like protein
VAGAIILTSTTPGHFSAAGAQGLSAFADQASVAIENARLFQQAHHLSVTDGLTGLNNRRHFFDLAKVEYERVQRYERPLSVVMIDIDQFKILNDTYGHLVGDAVLREIARRIQETVRTIDIVARYGGEEFVVLMPETDLAEAVLVAERVRRSVAESPVVVERVTVSTTISLGVAEIGDQCAGFDEVLKCSDKALYAAKATGRNRVEAYTGAGTDQGSVPAGTVRV